MNKLTQIASDAFKPFIAIIGYRSAASGQYYLGKRNIRNGKMGAEAPLTAKCIGQIVNAVSADNDELDYGIRGVIPTNVLYCNVSIGNTKLIWYRPPEKRILHFTSSTGIDDGEMWVPGLIYIAQNDTLRVLAFKGSKPRNILYLAPFMNVDENHVCLGTAHVEKPRDNSFANIIDYWERMFWGSDFSHILGRNPVKGNLATLTKNGIATGERFPTDQLIRIKITLKDILK